MLKQTYYLKLLLSTLFLSFVLFGCIQEKKEKVSFLKYQPYFDIVEHNIQSLTEDRKVSRKNIEEELKSTQTYKILVLDKIVSSEYLPLLTAINNGLRNIYTENNEELFGIDQELAMRVESLNNGKDKLDFVIKTIVLSTPNKGGYTQELVELFERYRKKFDLYGVPSKMYSIDGNNRAIEHSYNMTSIFYHINPNNKTLDAIYEANKKGAGRWFGHTNGQNYVYDYLATKESYIDYVKKNNPNSPYILKVDYEVTANQLYNAYYENEIAADDIYKGKRLAVKGVISDISQIMGVISVDLKTGDGLGWTKISCNMEDRDVVSKLRKGQKVTIIGTCDGLTLNVSIDLEDCELWNE